MKLGSLFDGIGGWLLAAKHAGVTPVWASEIDDFPAAVTRHHFPNVKQMGDITKIKAEDLEPVDIICAGSPCQDLSVAGKREGLSGERSGLFKTAIKIVHGLRKRTGKPRYFVWENVPGAFSSNKGMDFRAVLEEISQTEIPIPQGGKWAEAGMVEWGGGSLAWRVLDAQYWGVPQRRKRIFLVADFGGHSAGEILFERKGLSGDSTESQGTGEETAGNAGKGVDRAGETLTPWDVQSNKIQGINGKAAALYGGEGQGTHNGAVFDTRQIDSASGIAYSFASLASNSMKSKNQGGIAIFDMNHANNPVQSYNDKKCHTLTSRMGTGGNQVPVLHSYCIAGNTIDSQPQNGGNGTQCAHDGRGFNGQDVEQNKVVYPAGKVRRLTPTECERLQGLPDGYTDIEFKGKPAPDSRRYKALGNGMAQPCADYVIRRIQEVNDSGQTERLGTCR